MRRTSSPFPRRMSARSWPSAAAASRWRPATRFSTTTCSNWRELATSAPGSASSRRRAATPTTTWSASTARSAARVAIHPTYRGAADLREHLLSQDLIYVGGGSVISLLGTWRAHGIDSILAEAWRRGVILCGLSAGSLCWYSDGVTSFHGEVLRVRGLGLLPWSNCVHYGSKQGPREPYHAMLRRGMCPGYAAEDGSALHFRGSRMVAAVASRPDARAWCVGDGGDRVIETALPTRYLGEGPREGDELHAVA
jgi:peptidase E